MIKEITLHIKKYAANLSSIEPTPIQKKEYFEIYNKYKTIIESDIIKEIPQKALDEFMKKEFNSTVKKEKIVHILQDLYEEYTEE